MGNKQLFICTRGNSRLCNLGKSYGRRVKSSYEEKIYISIFQEILKKKKEKREMMKSEGILQRLNTCIMALNKSNSELKTLGLKKAQAEKAYKVKQAEEILKLREEKYPATLIMELVKGNKEVAELRSQRDAAESAHYACISSIENLRLEIYTIKSRLELFRIGLSN